MLSVRLRKRGSASEAGASFGAFWAAVVCSDLADGEFRTAVPLMTLTVTRSAFAVSVVGVAARLPWLLVTLPAGVVVDRHLPATVLRWAAALRLPLVIVTVLLAVARTLPVAALAAVAFAVASAGTFVDVSAQALLPTLMTGAKLRAANQKLQATQRLASQFGGPVLAGYAVTLGLGWGAGVAAVLFLAVAVLAGRVDATRYREDVRSDRAGAASDTGPFRAALTELRAGAAYFRQRPDLTRLAVLAGLCNLSFSMSVTILPVWAVAPGPLGLSKGYYGLLMGALAVGGTAASVVARPVLDRLGDGFILRWGAPLVGISLLLLAVRSPIVTGATLAFAGAAVMLWNLTVVSYRQTTIDRQLFGRVVAVYRWVTYGVLPLGSLLAGLIAELAGTAWVFAAAGALPLAGGLLLGVRRPAALPAEKP